MMIRLCNSLSTCSTLHPHLIPTTYSPPPPLSIRRNLSLGHRKIRRRGISVVTRGTPNSTIYIFALVFPLSLLAVTVFTSARIADKLDQKFFEELAVDQAILEAEEENENENEIPSPSKRETAPIRSRNRPKREVESSSV
ncbi:hypothetical protein ACJIZ3_016039 [Penstemon smallii]|uniref:Uncharacterized protein n=1 Tax=Penstemon smallii TaxID=265156 RepID=A0ABD3RSL6_9LAMI